MINKEELKKGFIEKLNNVYIDRLIDPLNELVTQKIDQAVEDERKRIEGGVIKLRSFNTKIGGLHDYLCVQEILALIRSPLNKDIQINNNKDIE